MVETSKQKREHLKTATAIGGICLLAAFSAQFGKTLNTYHQTGERPALDNPVAYVPDLAADTAIAIGRFVGADSTLAPAPTVATEHPTSVEFVDDPGLAAEVARQQPVAEFVPGPAGAPK